jgi:hypothetical protein
MASETAPAAAPLRVILSYAVPVTGAVLVSSWSALVAIFRFCMNVVVAVVQPLLAILQVLFAPTLFLLSPLVHVARVVWDITIRKPYALVGVAAAELYDIWVFVGVALTFGILLGWISRIVARAAIQTFLGTHSASSTRENDTLSPISPSAVDRAPRKGVAQPLMGRASGADVGPGARKEWRRVR